MEPKCEKCDYATRGGACVLGRNAKKCTSPEMRKGVHLSSKAFVVVLSRNFFLFSVAVVAILVLAVSGIAYTCTPGFCSKCHEMKDDFQSWKLSSHRNVNCITCHVKPGLLNLLIDKATVAPKSLLAKINGDYEKPINKKSDLSREIENENCKQCHTLKIKSSLSRGIKMNHLAHDNLGMRCTQCHNRVAHKIKGYDDYSVRKSCFECHDGKVVSNKCEVCHSETFVLEHKK